MHEPQPLEVAKSRVTGDAVLSRQTLSRARAEVGSVTGQSQERAAAPATRFPPGGRSAPWTESQLAAAAAWVAYQALCQPEGHLVRQLGGQEWSRARRRARPRCRPGGVVRRNSGNPSADGGGGFRARPAQRGSGRVTARPGVACSYGIPCAPCGAEVRRVGPGPYADRIPAPVFRVFKSREGPGERWSDASG